MKSHRYLNVMVSVNLTSAYPNLISKRVKLEQLDKPSLEVVPDKELKNLTMKRFWIFLRRIKSRINWINK